MDKGTRKLRLLSVEPMMAEAVEPGDDNNEELLGLEEDNRCPTPLKRSTRFDSRAMLRQIKRIMKIFGVDLDAAGNKLKCVISDNTSCNRRLAAQLSVPFVNCFAHLWALAMSSLTKEGGIFFDYTMAKVIDEARRVQKVFKNSSKASSCLKEQTNLVVMLPVVTRWSSNLICVRRYHKIFNHIRTAFQHPDCPPLSPPMDTSPVFQEELKDKLETLLSLNEMTMYLQKSGLGLSEAMLLFDIALNQDEASGFSGIGVDPSYLDLSNSVFSNAHFLSGVSKLQRNKSHELTTREKEEVKNLRTPSPVRVAVEAVESERNLLTALKKRKAEEPETYIDCDFILATAVDVERLWSLAKNLLTDKRRRMTTVMIQVILFLKENRNLEFMK